MAEEGVVQVFLPHDGAAAIVGVVGALQLDVLTERLDAEYGLPVSFEQSRFEVCRWVASSDKAELDKFLAAYPSSHRLRPRRRAGLHGDRAPSTCATSRSAGRRSPSPTSRTTRRRRERRKPPQGRKRRTFPIPALPPALARLRKRRARSLVLPDIACQPGKSLRPLLERLHNSIVFHCLERICSGGRERQNRVIIFPAKADNRTELGKRGRCAKPASWVQRESLIVKNF